MIHILLQLIFIEFFEKNSQLFNIKIIKFHILYIFFTLTLLYI